MLLIGWASAWAASPGGGSALTSELSPPERGTEEPPRTLSEVD